MNFLRKLLPAGRRKTNKDSLSIDPQHLEGSRDRGNRNRAERTRSLHAGGSVSGEENASLTKDNFRTRPTSSARAWRDSSTTNPPSVEYSVNQERVEPSSATPEDRGIHHSNNEASNIMTDSLGDLKEEAILGNPDTPSPKPSISDKASQIDKQEQKNKLVGALAAVSSSSQPPMNISAHSTRQSTLLHPQPGGGGGDALAALVSEASLPAAPARRKISASEALRLIAAYDSIPILEQNKLPRGGLSVDTLAVGRVQFGIPPETIKDSMRLGIPVPQVYIVPVERFCREIGPALGVNLAEFEFPAYFNFFVYKKRCTLVVDSDDAEENIRRVFSETLLGPAQFRREVNAIPYEEEDFAPDFPREAIPNFPKELKHFRIMPDGKELVIETLLEFRHFHEVRNGGDYLGVPPSCKEEESRSKSNAPVQSEDDEEEEEEGTEVPKDLNEMEDRERSSPWTYAHARGMGDVATVWPSHATPEQIKARNIPRVEIFKMPGGTEYIIHDINKKNVIVGRARLSGHVKVSESMSVDGFGGRSILDDDKINRRSSGGKASSSGNDMLCDSSDRSLSNVSLSPPPSFHPPSFGVTVLGNSHGFDKSGSVSGYVLWINGRGVMIDPPPYSSATLEREGIRPRTIVGIILTHCHADHDAGAFQKVLTGSPVVVITTPTIYKSFIRKYAALSALSPALLRHSHRYKQAIIGQPLRFQGATFHFTYTLHTIPCVGFRVEWRGRSMVFTGDHFNKPSAIDQLQETGVLSQARADDLRNLPLQDTDLLLHEAGAPPIHTPLEVLLELPMRVKKRLFVVHTSALPPDCELRVAPTGTAGTIRLDQVERTPSTGQLSVRMDGINMSAGSLGDGDFVWNGRSEYETRVESPAMAMSILTSFANLGGNNEAAQSRVARAARSNSVFDGSTSSQMPPLVSLRPASSTDAWFILNLLSAVPFLSSLSYSSTMEVLETARVDAYSMNDVIIPAARRSQVLCVVWEGTCSERSVAKSRHRAQSKLLGSISEESDKNAVWHAGDWTGPIALQPERKLSGVSNTSQTHDVVAVSSEGVKVITVDFSSLHAILKSGSSLYRKYLARKSYQEHARLDGSSSEHHSTTTEQLLDDAMKDLNVLELLNCNSALKKLNAVQKRHLESLAEGPISFPPGGRLWRAGTPVDKAFLIVSGTVTFGQMRRPGVSAADAQKKEKDKDKTNDHSMCDSLHEDVMKAIKDLGATSADSLVDDHSSMSFSSLDAEDHRITQQIAFDSTVSDSHDFAKLRRGLQQASEMSGDESVDEASSVETENESNLIEQLSEEADVGGAGGRSSRRSSLIRRRSSRARFTNKALGRLYSRRAFAGGLVFSRGHFLGDVTKMVAGLLAVDDIEDMEIGPEYGGGGLGLDSLLETTIFEKEGDHNIMHSSTLTAGKNGCVVLVFPKASLIPFLDEYPGLLLSLLGTQVVV